jgi:hypothetical protein
MTGECLKSRSIAIASGDFCSWQFRLAKKYSQGDLVPIGFSARDGVETP